MKMDENLSKNALFKVQYLKSDFIKLFEKYVVKPFVTLSFNFFNQFLLVITRLFKFSKSRHYWMDGFSYIEGHSQNFENCDLIEHISCENAILHILNRIFSFWKYSSRGLLRIIFTK